MKLKVLDTVVIMNGGEGHLYAVDQTYWRLDVTVCIRRDVVQKYKNTITLIVRITTSCRLVKTCTRDRKMLKPMEL